MKVTFLRHAVSIFNEKLISEKDCELSEAGKQQAMSLTGNYDVVVCSIMTRTKQTLAFSKIKYNDLYYSHTCREFRKDICDFLPHENHTILETNESLIERVEKCKTFLKENFDGRNVLVISHADFIFCMNGETKYPENGEFQILTI